MVYKLKGVQMKDYLEKILHMDVQMKESDSLYKELPLLYKGSYSIYQVVSGGVKWIAMQPKSDIRLTQLRKNRAFLENKKQLNVAVFLDKSSLYSKDKMIEEGIPFVVRDDTVYLPFLGVLLGKNQRELKPVHQISYLTQRLLLEGLYERYTMASVTNLANRLGVSKMAISKCLDEIEYLGLDVLITNGRRRYLSMKQDSRKSWEKIRPYLRNPVIKVFALNEDIRLKRKAGISALSEYSMLSDNSFPTYAIEKSEIKQTGIHEKRQASKNEDIGCLVFEVGYFNDSIKKDIQDPLSVVLSIKDEANDERVEQSIEDMLKEYVW